MNLLREWLECFDLRDGQIFWRKRPLSHFTCAAGANRFHAQFVGKPVCIWTPYQYPTVRATFRGKRRHVVMHRLMWALVNGRWPTDELDHINGDPQDYRIENLREVSHRENHRNVARRSDNTTGVTGVYATKGGRRWQAQIKTGGGGKVRTKTFTTFTEAVAARREWERELGFHSNHGQRRSLFRRSA